MSSNIPNQNMTTDGLCEFFFGLLDEMQMHHENGNVIKNFEYSSVKKTGGRYYIDLEHGLGSYGFVAPEVLLDCEKITAVSNIYSFGVIIDTLVRKNLFWTEQGFSKKTFEEWRSAQKYGVAVEPDNIFLEIIQACCRVDPAERIQSAEEVRKLAARNTILSEYLNTTLGYDGDSDIIDAVETSANDAEIVQDTTETYEDADLEVLEGREIGIDLGTSYSSVAYMKNGKVNVLKIRNDNMVPSALFFDSVSKIIYGRIAMQKGMQYPESLVSHFKRNLGKKIDVVYADSLNEKAEESGTSVEYSCTYIFDTNTLIDDPFIIEGISDNDKIVLPTIVIEEIDFRTNSPSTEIQARKAQSLIEKHKFRIEFCDSDLSLLPQDMFRNEIRTNNNQNDNKILSVAVGKHGEDTYLITSDKGLITKVALMNQKGFKVKTKTQKEFSYDKIHKKQVSDKSNSFKLMGEEAAALFLKYLKNEVTKKIGYVTRAYITVPANFDQFKVKAIKDAAEQAGFIEVETQKEPIAAAIAYGFGKDSKKKIFVYDFGGGTFDVTIIEMSDDDYRVIDYDGDPQLGGEDFTLSLVEYIEEHILDKFELDLNSLDESGLTPKAYWHNKIKLRTACEECKLHLSEFESSRIEVDIYVSENERKVFSKEVTRREFENLVRDLINKARSKLNDILIRNSLKTDDIDVVVLAGGTSSIPCIKDSVQKFFGKLPYADKNPAFLIAEGASILANETWASESGIQKKIKIYDKTVKDLGVAVKGHIFDCIVKAGVDLPYRCKPMEYSLVEDYQQNLEIEIFTRDSGKEHVRRTLDEGIECIGSVTISELPSLLKNESVVEVVFELTKENILSVNVEIKNLNGDIIRHGMSRIIQKGV